MTFYLLRWGTGEGCDYTIACNQRIDKLSATNIVDARTEAENILMPEEPDYWDKQRKHD